MLYQEQIHAYLQEHKSEIVRTLKELIKIPSVRGEASENAPFGEACAEALRYTRALYEQNGFEAELDCDGGYVLSYHGNGEKTLGLFAHADVVPAGEGWIYTSPFEPKEVDGFIVGRGSMDDKSGILISLYTAKMIKELALPFSSRLVMFTGGNEESGMQDIKNYLHRHTPPSFSIVADTGFPLFRGNKGRIRFALKSKEALPSGVKLSGGTGATVIGKAEAIFPYSPALYNALSKINDKKASLKIENDKITFHALGIPKHAALPEGSLSAVQVLCEKLLTVGIGIESKLFEDLLGMASSSYGEFFGLEASDAEFGRLTCVLTKISTDADGRIIADFNARRGDSVAYDHVISKFSEKAKEINFELLPDIDASVPHALPADNEFVTQLNEVIREYMGKESVTSYVNAGGTYRQYLKNAVETGTTIFGPDRFMPDGHGHVHQPDECISVEGLLNAIELTTLMVLKCDEIMKS